MSIEVIEQHKAFGGEQFKYRHTSNVLDCDMTFSLFLPSNKENQKIPLIWWLSGLTCTDDNFTHKSGIQRIAEQYNVAVVAPDTSPRGENLPNDEGYDLGQGASFYVNATQSPWAKNYQMYTYILEELSTIVKELVPNFSEKESIMGHSMGGHGALTIGMKNANRFKAISAFSPILTPSQTPWGQKALTSYLGEDKEAWKEYDATELIQEENTPPILIMQGLGDNFYPNELSEKDFLEKAQGKVEYRQLEGYDHSYYFIASFLEEHVVFHASHLSE